MEIGGRFPSKQVRTKSPRALYLINGILYLLYLEKQVSNPHPVTIELPEKNKLRNPFALLKKYYVFLFLFFLFGAEVHHNSNIVLVFPRT